MEESGAIAITVAKAAVMFQGIPLKVVKSFAFDYAIAQCGKPQISGKKEQKEKKLSI